MFCGRCGSPNQESARFCALCGNPLQAAEQPPAPPAAVASQPVAASTPAPFAEPPSTSGKAVASLLCGFLFFFFPAAVAAVILGHLSLSDIKKSAGRLTGRGVAVAGLIFGYMGLILLPILLFAGLLTIPRILRARIAANETSAIASLRQIESAANAYSATYHNGYPLNLTTLSGAGLQDCDHAGFIDGVLASGFRNGYVFIYQPSDESEAPNAAPKAPADGCTAAGAPGFSVMAEPSRHGSTGDRSFYMDQTGVIRFERNGVPTADSPPVK